MISSSMEQRKRARIGIDVGGTFTDVLLFEETTGELTVEKLPSTPGDPAQAIVAGALRALEASGTAIGSVVFFGHGSTVATNALLQHRGAKVGLITTTGFRDLLAIGRQARPHLYDLQVDKPEPLVPRRLRLEARERLAYDGRVLTPLDRDDVRTAAEHLGRAGVEAVAISFLHAYRNPEHEQTAKSIVATTLPDVYLSVAHEVLPEFREFERLNSTVVNAYLGPVVSRYVGSLERRLDELGLRCRPYMTQSNGGV
ncbi:MAG: hydantoinase/oxoprolinase family protein, partial [Chloroflexi bacterium]|nr:hydantoinase/oxoprolinase family protein [Chloroflexota bacterium]